MLGIDPAAFDRQDIHIHVPADAIPKDGPSAGVALFTALASLLLERTVRPDVAMTGEITLRGLVLPVGGIKEKVLAAHRAGLTKVLLPARNRRDFEEIPESVRRQMAFVWLETVGDALTEALEVADVPTHLTVGDRPWCHPSRRFLDTQVDGARSTSPRGSDAPASPFE